MTTSAAHLCTLIASPVEGIYGTEIISARSYERHSHDTFGIGLMDEGAQRSWSGRGGVEAYAGDIITTNPGEVHDGQPHDGNACRRWRMVYLEPATLAKFSFSAEDGRALRAYLTRPVINDPSLARQMRHLFNCLARWRQLRPGTATAEALACDEATAQVCTLLLTRYGTHKPTPTVDLNIRTARDQLASDLVAPPTLAELAAPLGLSKFQLLRGFEKSYGLSPHRWLVQQRVSRARHLISRGTDLSEAAAACGFSDQSHMNRFFVAQLGFTPGTWKRNCRPHS